MTEPRCTCRPGIDGSGWYHQPNCALERAVHGGEPPESDTRTDTDATGDGVSVPEQTPALVYRYRADRIWECVRCFFRWRTNERLR